MAIAITTQLLHQSAAPQPLGRVTLAGTIRQSGGIGHQNMRVLGAYAVVYLLAGGGPFRDGLGRRQTVSAGDLLLVFPDVAHEYGPEPGGAWDEIYLVFEGPVFDAWRAAGLLDPRDPIWHAEPIDYVHQQFRAVLGDDPATADPLVMAARLQVLLADLRALRQRGKVPEPDLAWLAEARQHLEPGLAGPPEVRAVARTLGLSYERFRKRFTALAGVSPKRYADQRVIARACALLHRRPMTNRALAQACGFCDEFHFARRFRQLTGMWPREFRRSLPGR